MRKFMLLAGIAGMIAFTAVSCGDGGDNVKTETADANTIYACPMHPEVTSDGPGDCHKCGMPLEKMSTEEHQEMMNEE